MSPDLLRDLFNEIYIRQSDVSLCEKEWRILIWNESTIFFIILNCYCNRFVIENKGNNLFKKKASVYIRGKHNFSWNKHQFITERINSLLKKKHCLLKKESMAY